MSGVVHPVGPQPPKVYWRRRLIFIGLVLFTTVVIARSFSGGSGEPKAAAQPSISATPKVSSSESATPASSATPTVTPSAQMSVDPSTDPILDMTPTETPSVNPTPPAGTCKDSDVKVSIAIDHTDIKVGAGLGLTMTVKNTSATSCKRDVGSGANEITIISGPALVWSTDHCTPATDSNYVNLAPGKSWKVHVIWNGKLSAKGCQILSVAQHGAYWAHARNGALMSSGARFVVE